ncbi:MAG: hypothetical protein HY243_15505 [Proteobacteria bacterium]|nr:hypothetical protein [Pseudomonadota bacterium]
MKRSHAAAAFVGVLCMSALPALTSALADSTGIGKGSPSADAPAAMDKSMPPPPMMAAELSGTGKVKFVAHNKSRFKCWWGGKLHTFEISRTTQFRRGTNPATVGDLKTGETVEVQYHGAGATMTADVVVISP